jgi:hypothetical protein
MSTINVEREIDLDNGTIVTVELEIEGTFDANYGADADGNRGVGRWLVESHSYEVSSEDELSDDEESEVKEKVEELVYDSDWDFDQAELDREADKEEEELY